MKKTELTNLIESIVRKQLNEDRMGSLFGLKIGDKFKIFDDAKLQIRGFMYNLKYNDYKDVVFTVEKINSTTVMASGDVPDKYKNSNGLIPFKKISTDHFRSAGKNISVKIVEPGGLAIEPSKFYAFKKAVDELRLTEIQIEDLDNISNLLKDLYE